MKKLKLFVILALFFTLVSDTAPILAQRKQGGEWKLVFRDEFRLKNGSQPDARHWSCPSRGWSTWNRWVSDSKRVAFIRNGKLVCRAIRNVEHPADTARMLTGAVETRGKFSFQYGKIEVRAKTNLHAGNFPAIWLMPQPPAPSHPDGGEIDIFESFGSHRDAHHTVHNHWSLTLKHADRPKNHFVKGYFDVDKWHVYGLEWSPGSLVFTIDGTATGVYNKSSDAEALANGQWPFDRPFYIILNQSVRQFGTPFGGDPDLDYVYETQFDWVRVYQLNGAKRGSYKKP